MKNLSNRLLKKHRKQNPNQHKRYGKKRNRDNKKILEYCGEVI